MRRIERARGRGLTLAVSAALLGLGLEQLLGLARMLQEGRDARLGGVRSGALKSGASSPEPYWCEGRAKAQRRRSFSGRLRFRPFQNLIEEFPPSNSAGWPCVAVQLRANFFNKADPALLPA